LITIGSPNLGVAKIPYCAHGIFCDIINYFIRNSIYQTIMQQMIAPAGYFRDPNQMEAYLENSIFLRYLLNEVDHPLKERNKQRFVALNSLKIKV